MPGWMISMPDWLTSCPLRDRRRRRRLVELCAAPACLVAVLLPRVEIVPHVEGLLGDVVPVPVGPHVLEEAHELLLLDAMEPHPVARPQQERLIAKDGVATLQVVDRQAASEKL